MTGRGLLVRVAIVAAVAVLVGGIAYGMSDAQDPRYAATTRLLFGPPPPELRLIGLGRESDEEERSLANRVQEVSSFDIARRTASVLGNRDYDADDVANDITVTGERTADVVTISAETDSTGFSEELVGEYRHQFILRQQEIVQVRARTAREALDSSLRQLPPRSQFGFRGDVLRTQIGALKVLERTGGNPLIIEGIRVFDDPVSPKTDRNTLFGLLFGAILGIGLVSLREATRPRRDPEQTSPAPISEVGPPERERAA